MSYMYGIGCTRGWRAVILNGRAKMHGEWAFFTLLQTPAVSLYS